MNEWISTKDRVPTMADWHESDTGRYLCSVIIPDKGLYKSNIVVLGYDTVERHWTCEGMIVTHWMQLPHLPKDVLLLRN